MEKIKVLLIDDDEDDYILTRDIFNQIPNHQKYELTWVDTFEKGINAILKKQYAIYLCDYRLGKYTGLDLLSEAILSGSKEPIIILTGKGDYEIDEKAMNIGAADYLVKDEIDSASLDRTLRYALKQSETLKALKESEDKFKVIFEKAKDPILISDYTGKVYDINKAGLQFFDYKITEALLLNDRELFQNQEDRDNFIQELETKGAVSDFECNLISSSGQVYFCSLSSFLQIDTHNMIEVYHTIVHDLTYRKSVEDKSVHLGKMSLSEHIAKSFAEEIRNPLSTINLVLDELASDENLAYDETVQANLEIVKANCDKINKLTQDFIISTETKAIQLQKQSIVRVIDEALAEVNDLIVGHNITLQKDILTTDLSILLDKKQVKSALVNILHNAVEAMETYPKVLNISSINDSGIYSILIEDNGKGIPKEEQDKIFEPFFTTRKNVNGLGLTDAQRIIMAHNGQITYKPQPKGSLFVIEIPLNLETLV